MKLHFLGTGHGTALNCYNSCFVIENEKKEYFLIDSGGGNTLLNNLKAINIDVNQIYNAFITHTHIDHILGVIWFIRIIAKKYFKNSNEKNTRIYGNKEVIHAIKTICNEILPIDFVNLLGRKIELIIVNNDEKINVLDYEFMFIDLYATKVRQFGFVAKCNNKKITFTGDEYCKEEIKKYIYNSDYLIADGYMCGKEAEEYNPMKRHGHSSVKYISQIANDENVANLILIHTLDNDLENRRKMFTEDAKMYYNGNIYIPDDLDSINID